MADKYGLGEDFDIYELPKQYTVKSRKAPVEEKKAKRKITLSPVSVVFFALVFVLFASLVYNYTQINELTVDKNRMEREIVTLKEENAELAVQAERKLDLVAIEKIAESRLGMVKVKKADVQYIDLSQCASIQAESAESENENSVENLLSSIAGSLSVILGYME